MLDTETERHAQNRRQNDGATTAATPRQRNPAASGTERSLHAWIMLHTCQIVTRNAHQGSSPAALCCLMVLICVVRVGLCLIVCERACVRATRGYRAGGGLGCEVHHSCCCCWSLADSQWVSHFDVAVARQAQARTECACIALLPVGLIWVGG